MDTLVPNDLWAMIAPLLSPEREKPRGGRRRTTDRAGLAVLGGGVQRQDELVATGGVASSQRLGQHPWFVERNLAWREHSRRLTIRYERSTDLQFVFTALACTLICQTQAKRYRP